MKSQTSLQLLEHLQAQGITSDKFAQIEQKLSTELKRRKEIKRLEGSLFEFVKAAWSSIDSAPFQSNWAIEALCLHLEAVTKGDIKRLLVNFPPRASKTSVVSICYPAWVWARTERTHTSGPGVQFLCSSYNHDLSLQNSTKTRRLILSPWYQERWGKRYSFREDQNTKSQFDTSEGGSRIATSVGGSLLGIGGSILLADDLHNTETVESEAERETVTNYWKEFSSTRLNDPQLSAIVVVMQRLHQQDVSGIIIEGNEFGEWTHLMIPMHHDLKRHCETVLKYDDEGEPEITWEDPRTEEGELMWPDRFDEVSVASIERSLGKYMSSGRLEQSPTPKEGSIFSSKDWMLYPEQGEKFKPDGTPEVKLEYPSLDFMMAYVDTAMTTKEENDWSAMTVWGVWTDYKGIPKAIMIDAWQARLEFFPLVEKVKATAKARKIDMLMIEAKANGLSVAQEIQRLTAGNEYAVKTDVPKGDKVARAYSIQHLFSNKLIYAPNRKWSDMVIAECESFPKGAHDDLCFVRGTRIATKRGEVPIEEVKKGDFALTPLGWRRVIASGFTGIRPVITKQGLTGTKNHPVFVVDGFYPLDTVVEASTLSRINLCDLLKITPLKRLFLKELRSAEWVARGDTILANHAVMQAEETLRDCTLQCGSIILARRLRRVLKFTTKTATHLISALKILNAYQCANIAAWLRKILTEKNRGTISKTLGQWLQLGTNLKRAALGTGSMSRIAWISTDMHLERSREPETAFGVEKNLNTKATRKVFAQTSANRNTRALPAVDTNSFIHTMQPVFNLTVEEAHCYYANRILVHNCDTVVGALRYLRACGMLELKDEVSDRLNRQFRPVGEPERLYPV